MVGGGGDSGVRGRRRTAEGEELERVLRLVAEAGRINAFEPGKVKNK